MSESLPISVVMPVYNGEKFLREAIDSILSQTFSDFEFIIVDDGSTDNSLNIIRSYTDQRIRVIENESNLGGSTSRNTGMEMSRGKYIAVMDADDISLSGRFARQVSFMNTNPHIDVCGSQREDFGAKTNKFIVYKEHEDIVTNFLFSCKINHSSIFMRKDTLLSLDGFYDPTAQFTEDYDLWVRLFLKGAKFANLNETLIKYRWHESNASVAFADDQKLKASEVRKQLFEQLSINDVNAKTQLHETLRSGKNLDLHSLDKVYVWICELLEANQKTKLFSQKTLKKRLGRKWFMLHNASAKGGLAVLRSYFKKPAPSYADLSIGLLAKFIIKCLVRHRPQVIK